MKIAFVDVCNSLADVNGRVREMGYDPSNLSLPPTMDLWWDSAMYLSCNPMTASIDHVKELSKQGYELVFITARPIEMLPTTLLWLEKYGIPSSQILCSHGKHKGNMVVEYLSNFTKHPVTDVVIIEDSATEIERYREVWNKLPSNSQLHIIDQPYNRHLEGDLRIENTVEQPDILVRSQ